MVYYIDDLNSKLLSNCKKQNEVKKYFKNQGGYLYTPLLIYILSSTDMRYT